MDSLIIDTNVFLRFLLDDIPSQTKKATEVLIKAKSKRLKIFVPQIIIFEILFALDKYYKFPKTEVMEKVRTLLATSYLDIEDRAVFQEALEVFKSKNIDFVDCFLICKAKESNSILFTFDKDLSKLVSIKI